MLSAETSRNGFDFYFMELNDAHSFAAFMTSVYPMKVSRAQKLVSEDFKNNTANIKYTTVCDMVHLNRHDLIVCDKRAAKEGCSAGRLNGRLCLVNKVSGTLQLVDAAPPRSGIEECMYDLHPEKYWKGEKHFRMIFSAKQLVRFVVMDVELCEEDSHYGGGNDDHPKYAGQSDVNKYSLADVTVAREADFGRSDETFQCTTHLGNLLDIGDTVLGYDLVSSVLTGTDEWSVNNSFNSSFNMPDVVLVKKVKGGGVEGDVEEDKPAAGKLKKAKSSGSKKRARRQVKEESKEKELAATLGRMGFGGATGDDGASEDVWDAGRKVFDDDLEKDIELVGEANEDDVEDGGKDACEGSVED